MRKLKGKVWMGDNYEEVELEVSDEAYEKVMGGITTHLSIGPFKASQPELEHRNLGTAVRGTLCDLSYCYGQLPECKYRHDPTDEVGRPQLYYARDILKPGYYAYFGSSLINDFSIQRLGRQTEEFAAEMAEQLGDIVFHVSNYDYGLQVDSK